MARHRPHRKASITADLGSLGFLLIISLIAGFAELIGRVWKSRMSYAYCFCKDRYTVKKKYTKYKMNVKYNK